MSVSRHISPPFFPFLWEYWEYDKLPVHQPVEFLWGEGSVALESPHGNWGDNTWRKLFITERRCTAAISAHHAYSLFTFFYPLPLLVCCCIRNLNELLEKDNNNILFVCLHLGHPTVFRHDALARPPLCRLYWGVISNAAVKPAAFRPQCCLCYSCYTFPWWLFEPRPGVAVGRLPPRATWTDSTLLLWQEQSAVYRPAIKAWRPPYFTSYPRLNSNILFVP